MAQTGVRFPLPAPSKQLSFFGLNNNLFCIFKNGIIIAMGRKKLKKGSNTIVIVRKIISIIFMIAVFSIPPLLSNATNFSYFGMSEGLLLIVVAFSAHPFSIFCIGFMHWHWSKRFLLGLVIPWLFLFELAVFSPPYSQNGDLVFLFFGVILFVITGVFLAAILKDSVDKR